MTTSRDQMTRRISELVDGRPVRWADPRRRTGDYDGRERTLEIFNADAGEQRALLGRLRPVRDELEAAAGGPIVFIFHTCRESARLHETFVEAFLRAQVEADARAPVELRLDEIVRVATDLPLERRHGDREGSRRLPRTAKAA
ncbi:MAG TPA: hypothetical protein VHE35_01690 [Kofleriaceae bacterium]|nr:hypothetical protein [Kofleriaceae bacterium]